MCPLKASRATFGKIRLSHHSFQKLFSTCHNPLWKNCFFPNGLPILFLPMSIKHWEYSIQDCSSWICITGKKCSYNLKRPQFTFPVWRFQVIKTQQQMQLSVFSSPPPTLSHSAMKFTANIGLIGRGFSLYQNTKTIVPILHWVVVMLSR